MTVQELIDELTKLPPSLSVYVGYYYEYRHRSGYRHGAIDDIRIEEWQQNLQMNKVVVLGT